MFLKKLRDDPPVTCTKAHPSKSTEKLFLQTVRKKITSSDTMTSRYGASGNHGFKMPLQKVAEKTGCHCRESEPCQTAEKNSFFTDI
jgi:hypothetical protein